MRFSIVSLLLLLVSQTVNSAAKIEHWQTEQGVDVYYVETKGLPMVDISVVFDAGSARDGYQYGIAALSSALLDAGAGSWDADEIAKRFERVGAQFGTGVSKDMAWMSLRSLTEQKLLQSSLQTMQGILTQPSFNEQDFQREKSRTLASLKQREESPGSLASMAFFNSIYKGHPYAHPESGVIETVSGLSAEDLKSFYRQYYVANNAMVVIVGELTKEKAKSIAGSLMSGLARGKKAEPIAKVSFTAKAVNKQIEFPSSQTHVLSGIVGMRRKDPDYFDLYIGNHILGGSGLVSQLFAEVREKRGLAYSAYSYFSPLFRKGPFIMGLQTRNDQTSQAVSVLHATLNDFVNNGPTEKALLAAKKNITGGFAMRFDTNSKLSRYVSMIGFYKLPLDYLDTFQQKIENVTVASVKSAFKRRVKTELLHTIMVGGLQ